MTEKIEKFINESIRPYINSHGGDINIVSLDDNILRLRLTGQCMTCPAAQNTFEDIIENKIKEAFPKIKAVLPVNDVPEEMLDMAKKILEHRI